jgi:hypothetical protein
LWTTFLLLPSQNESAKTVIPSNEDSKLQQMRSRITKKFPVADFNAFRNALDPHGILSNQLIEELFNSDKKN